MRPDGAVLVQRRPAGKPMAGLWEFPGGKVERGEAPVTALVRELDEELALRIDPGALSAETFASEALSDRQLVLLLYSTAVDGHVDVEKVEAAELRWVQPRDLHRLAMPPADRPLVAHLVARSAQPFPSV